MCDCNLWGQAFWRDTVIGEAGVCVVERDAVRKGGCRPEGLTTHGC